MGQYRARDLVNVPSLLSWARLPLAVAFVFVRNDPWIALAVLIASGLTDVLDGFYARRYNQVTATGAALDPVTDKAFVLTVVITLVVAGKLTVWSVLLLSTREILELPLVVWYSVSRRARRGRQKHPMANVPGKAATALQFVTIVAALFRWEHTGTCVAVTAGAGVVAGVAYWVRAIQDAKRADSGE